jgi:hypothetical protein
MFCGICNLLLKYRMLGEGILKVVKGHQVLLWRLEDRLSISVNPEVLIF